MVDNKLNGNQSMKLRNNYEQRNINRNYENNFTKNENISNQNVFNFIKSKGVIDDHNLFKLKNYGRNLKYIIV